MKLLLPAWLRYLGISSVLEMDVKQKKGQCGLSGYLGECFNLNWKHELWIAMFCMLENWVRDVRRRFSVDSKGFASVC